MCGMEVMVMRKLIVGIIILSQRHVPPMASCHVPRSYLYLFLLEPVVFNPLVDFKVRILGHVWTSDAVKHPLSNGC